MCTAVSTQVSRAVPGRGSKGRYAWRDTGRVGWTNSPLALVLQMTSHYGHKRDRSVF